MLIKLLNNNLKLTQFIITLLLFFGLIVVVQPEAHNYLWRLPETIFWKIPIMVNDVFIFLIYDWMPIDTYDAELDITEESTLIREISRSFSGFILFCINFIREILLGGNKTIVAFSSWDFVGENKWAYWPALPWTAVTGFAFIIGYMLNGRMLSMLAGFSMLYIALFGQWKPAMETLSFVLIAAPFAVILGLVMGVIAYKVRGFRAFLAPILNIAQTMPHFSYLVPVVALYGIGDHAGAIATIIFATPPMIRLTLLGMDNVPQETIESGVMSGCNNPQLLFRVLIPSARHDILIGVNQVIMQCLAMAVIASFIGATGLGYDLLVALNQLKIGQALELGVSIVLIAIVLDKLSLAWANKQIDYFADLSLYKRHRYSLMALLWLVFTIALATLSQIFSNDKVNYFYFIPEDRGYTTETFWDFIVDWIVVNWYHGLQGFNYFMIKSILIPMKLAYLAMPVSATIVLAVGVGFICGGIKSVLTVGFFLLFIALTPWWDKALITAYIATFATIVSIIIGVSTGILCAGNRRAEKFILLMCDTFQTFPSFIYLIPVIMLFGVSDVSVIIAVIVYATIPATRYTVEGLRNVPQSLNDAGSMCGISRIQRLLMIELPLAFPHIMLGINQTFIFALFMVIIGAFIGTDDLGQLIMQSLSRENAIGNGIMLGLCVSFIGLAVDHLINKLAKNRMRELSIA